MPSRTTEPSQGRKPCPSYFLVRTTGEIVPLIAVDELPVGTTLIDVPRTLELEATKGMLNLGLQRSSGVHYQIGSTPLQAKTAQIPTQPKNSVSRNPPQAAPAPESTSSSEDEENDSETEVAAPLPPTTARAPIQTTQHTQVRNSIPSAYTNPQNNTPLCRHWCTHGICKWGQQCRYKHIMPMTLHGLQEVGLRDWPAWYRGLNPGYFVDSRDGPVTGRGIGLKGVQRGGLRLRREEREKRVGGERRAALAKGEELGDEILRKLKGLEKEKEREREIIVKSKMEHEKERLRKAAVVEGNAAAVERATASNTLRWEDDDSEAEELERERVEEKKKKLESAGEGGRKLVDV